MQGIVWFRAVKVTIVEFFKNSSFTGFKLFFYLQNSIFLQIIWVPFIIVGITGGTIMTWNFIYYYSLDPTVTYINGFDLSLSKVPFPSVSICSVNKISEKAIKEYAKSISALRPEFDEKTLVKQFHLFGGYYDSSSWNIDYSYDLQIFLNKLHPSSAGIHNISEVLRMLAPKCEYLLRKCSWAGKIYPCAEIFTTLATPEGFCCVFNYNRPTNRKSETVVRNLQLVGEDLGLKVLLNTSLDDYFFTKRSSLGFIVQIFNNYIFPDILTGKLKEFPIPPNTNLFSTLIPSSLINEAKVRQYKTGQRHCYFRNELPKEYGWYYSQQECLLRCKLQSIQALCHCVPYYTPGDLIDLDKPITYCDLTHLECFKRYNPRWSTYRPAKRIISLELEMEDGLNCPKCIPMCDDYDYEYYLDNIDFPDSIQSNDDEFLINETNLEEASLLRIFYDKLGALQYKKQTVYTTYGIFGNIGGILSFWIGSSMVCLIEIVYFMTIRLYQNLMKFRVINNDENLPDVDPPKYGDLRQNKKRAAHK